MEFPYGPGYDQYGRTIGLRRRSSTSHVALPAFHAPSAAISVPAARRLTLRGIPTPFTDAAEVSSPVSIPLLASSASNLTPQSYFLNTPFAPATFRAWILTSRSTAIAASYAPSTASLPATKAKRIIFELLDAATEENLDRIKDIETAVKLLNELDIWWTMKPTREEIEAARFPGKGERAAVRKAEQKRKKRERVEAEQAEAKARKVEEKEMARRQREVMEAKEVAKFERDKMRGDEVFELENYIAIRDPEQARQL
ncbi:uncharacterized protein L3040_006790 [Drepanopeziza brunnea f. sp. 'multigermtubi']|uniref:Uncharacterized protein n=1 Tax=Marssonina brunnea f. sp. multigermtubi (strain MB_m1) TaxID=1072389 RepID=K1WP14_MARBU|nr:uncharacterized protein MBM_02662 [Drepanopeziza brunnea f. sp. 'multigermtubi' MB_m1]EKD19425.1 hypothetical protein MBM_02662 [Drepanopeziza brunnea f. sp. 'multigermtubi' MB_m1]KAJ5037914.1 hypothetical protein L3040_006790 [Drepanopeziza brunnea f. sp. 'multigermtubi']